MEHAKKIIIKSINIIRALIVSFLINVCAIILLNSENFDNNENNGAIFLIFVYMIVSTYFLIKYFDISHKITKSSKNNVYLLFGIPYTLLLLSLLIYDGSLENHVVLKNFVFGLILSVFVYIKYGQKLIIKKDYFEEREISVEINQVEKENSEDEIDLTKLKEIYYTLENNLVKNKFNEILWMLDLIIKKKESFNHEQKHNIKRIVDSELYKLIKVYSELPFETKKENEKNIIIGLEKVNNYLKNVKKGIIQDDVNEINKQINLINQRYKK